MSWRPKGWTNLHNDIKSSRMLRVGTLRQETSDFEIYEASADALWQGVQNKIAKLSNETKDDKMFRVKLMLWLTEEK